MDDSERRKQLEGIHEAIQKGAFQQMGMNEAKRMLEKHLRGEKAKDDTVTLPRAEHEAMRKEYDNLRARVAELERERDQLALSLSATRAERDHAARSAELWESEYRTCYAAMEDYKHAWLEGRAIMAVSMYFGRMRGPDAWQFMTAGRFPSDDICLIEPTRSRGLYRELYAGSAPVPAAQSFEITKMNFCAECRRPMAPTRTECPACHTPVPAAHKWMCPETETPCGSVRCLNSCEASQAEESTISAYRAALRQLARDALDALRSDGSCGPIVDIHGLQTTAAQAEAKVADGVVRHIAEIVHNGGLRGIDPYNAIRLIRLLTLDVWDKSGTIDDMKDRVDAAMLAAKAKGG